MKTNDRKALHQLSVEEIRAKISETENELFLERMNKVAGKLKNTAKLRVLRKEVAQMKTILKELELLPAQK